MDTGASGTTQARIWAAFVAVKAFLRRGIWDTILGKTTVDVAEWKPIHEAARVASEEEGNVSPRVAEAMQTALGGLERDLNEFLGTLRLFVADRAAHDEQYWLKALNSGLDTARTHFEAALNELGKALEGAAPAPAPDRLQALYELLALLFDANEFRMWLRFGPQGEEILRMLPGDGQSESELLFKAAELLERRNLVDEAFFERLRQHVPRQAAAIERVRAIWLGR